MKPINVLLIVAQEKLKPLLDKQFSDNNSIKFNINCTGIKDAENISKTGNNTFDVILFDENIPEKTLIRLAKLYRASGINTPILLLTKISDNYLPGKLLQAGIDDVINIAEINTPVFWWSLMSVIKQTENRKKAIEFDVIHNRFENISKKISSIIHDINNPLSIIRLAAFNLSQIETQDNKSKLFIDAINKNVEILQDQIKRLKILNKELNNHSDVVNEVISIKSE